MRCFQKIDEYLFRLINSSGWEQMDAVMILISSKYGFGFHYIYLFYIKSIIISK